MTGEDCLGSGSDSCVDGDWRWTTMGTEWASRFTRLSKSALPKNLSLRMGGPHP